MKAQPALFNTIRKSVELLNDFAQSSSLPDRFDESTILTMAYQGAIHLSVLLPEPFRFSKKNGKPVKPQFVPKGWGEFRIDRITAYDLMVADGGPVDLKSILNHRPDGGTDVYRSTDPKSTRVAVADLRVEYAELNRLALAFLTRHRDRVGAVNSESPADDAVAKPRESAPGGSPPSTAGDVWPVTSESGVEVKAPVPLQRFQESEILRVIVELGHNPKAIPANKPGKAGLKYEVRRKLDYTNKVFDLAWERLRKNDEIVNSLDSHPSN
ncbi:hypothetical protein [Paraburkholderia sp. RL17-381-BIF-C]|uniref:hypothetical protein n=1 Tax=Paraburkholderia sp. RL17-381-BIF-C TaxID=3031635 RepID=UPI0038BAD560